jgi:uncharacterized protein YndB with AHSA1/START domain
MVTLPTDEQILITREFDAPKHLVWKAWTTTELIRRWWAGQRGETTLVEHDFRVGGAWRYVLIAQGYEVGFHGEFREIVEHERIVWTEHYEAAPPDSEPGVNTATFTEQDGRTTLTLLCQYVSKEVRDQVVESGMELGMQEQMDIIEEIAISLG